MKLIRIPSGPILDIEMIKRVDCSVSEGQPNRLFIELSGNADGTTLSENEDIDMFLAALEENGADMGPIRKQLETWVPSGLALPAVLGLDK